MDTTVTTTCQHWPVIYGCVTSSMVSLIIPRRNFSFRAPHNLNKPEYKHDCLTRKTARPLHTLHCGQSFSGTFFEQIRDNTQFPELPWWQTVDTTHRGNMACDHLHVWKVGSLEVTEESSHWGDTNFRRGKWEEYTRNSGGGNMPHVGDLAVWLAYSL